MTSEQIQIALAIGTVLVSGVGSYYAALSGVKIQLARIITEIEWLKSSRVERDGEIDKRISELEGRVRSVEFGRGRNPQHGD